MLDSSEIQNKVVYVTKRNGETKNFDTSKIEIAVSKAMKSIGIRSKSIPKEVASEVLIKLNKD